MFKTVTKFIDQFGPQSEFERYLEKLQRTDPTGAPSRELARRDYREMKDRSRYNPYGMN
jgi:hypothetical protein